MLPYAPPGKPAADPPLHPDAWPEMTQAAREARALDRLADPRPWRAELERLAHHDPEYVYDIGHEYETDWTTDPDYATDGIHLYEFDEDGILSPRDKRHDRTRDTSEDTAEGVLDNHVETEVELTIPAAIARQLGLKTKEGKLKETVRPDLMVLAPASRCRLTTASCRVDRGTRPRSWCWRFCRRPPRTRTLTKNSVCTRPWVSASTCCTTLGASVPRIRRRSC